MDKQEASHIPVLRDEVVRVLQPSSGKTFVDCTLGRGGHTRALLEAGAEVIAMDQDEAAILDAEANPCFAGARLRLIHSNFRNLRAVLEPVGRVHGILMDLGVSSPQLDVAERGFSFQNDGPLDMRMDPSRRQTAADLVNTASAAELEDIFRSLGEEPRARSIARRIERERPFASTLQLAHCVEREVHRTGRRHPATRVFQALRLAVNDELGALRDALVQSVDCLMPGGRLAVITFHSLEDRIVKNFLRDTSRAEIDRPEWTAPRPNPDYFFHPIKSTPLVPSPEEIRTNPRARSARLRAVERI